LQSQSYRESKQLIDVEVVQVESSINDDDLIYSGDPEQVEPSDYFEISLSKLENEQRNTLFGGVKGSAAKKSGGEDAENSCGCFSVLRRKFF
jgi:hypothetical protein